MPKGHQQPRKSAGSTSTSDSSSEEEGERNPRKRRPISGGGHPTTDKGPRRAAAAAGDALTSRIAELEKSLEVERAARETESAKLTFLVRGMLRPMRDDGYSAQDKGQV